VKNWLWIGFAVVMPLPWLVARVIGFHGPPAIVAMMTGVAILGAAFLLSWAAEVVQLDISQGLAVAMLALIAVLPEYSVDAYFAWRAGQDPSYTGFAVANMTGGNRLLIGLGWSLVVLIFLWRARKRKVEFDRSQMLELAVLAAATLYAFSIPLKGSISLIDAVVLVALFGFYLLATSRGKSEAPELEGPAEIIGRLPVLSRRVVTGGLFVFAAATIFLSAEPFAEGLVASGKGLGIDEFILVQWLAPLASEAPEFIVAILFALHGKPQLGLRTMISSKVNQWTLLIGTLPVVYSVSLGQFSALPLDARQVQEVLLTAAQSAFAIVLLAGFSLSYWGALALLAFFLVQLILPETRLFFSVAYVVMAVGLAVIDPGRRRGLAQMPGCILSLVTSAVHPARQVSVVEGGEGQIDEDRNAADRLPPAG
jgi:cation:H+ antiporter